MVACELAKIAKIWQLGEHKMGYRKECLSVTVTFHEPFPHVVIYLTEDMQTTLCVMHERDTSMNCIRAMQPKKSETHESSLVCVRSF